MYSAEEFDETKTKILKYILYKKRTEKEIRTKFENNYDKELFENVIDYLKETKYIDDSEYIKKYVDNAILLKKLSNIELKYKLIIKGLNNNLIEDFYYENKDKLQEYEIESASNIIVKKRREMEDESIKSYLLKKGYKKENIELAFESNKN